MKIGGTPPGGDNFRIPEPDGPKPGKTDGAGGARFGDKLQGAEGAPKESPRAGGAEGPRTKELREVLSGIDKNDPAAVEQAADKMVDWVLSEQFGEGILELKGADELRKSVRDQLLGDPSGEARIKQILDQI
jgi:hypothetical protein